MKKIVIHSQNGIRPEQKLATKEAVEEFVSMFPEYKNSLKVEFRDDASINDKEISQSQYENLSAREKNDYILSPRGTWLVPYQSMEWFMAKATENMPRGKVDVKKLTTLQVDRIANSSNDEIVINLVNGELVSNRSGTSFCYGYQTGRYEEKPSGEKTPIADAVSVSATSCGNIELLKTIVIHELGHVFNATHSDRANTIEHNGSHCTNDLCIMGDSNYPELNEERLRRKSQNRPPFCEECITSMREYMRAMPGMEREITTQRQTEPTHRILCRPDVFTETMPTLPHNDNSWKNDFQTFYKQVAARDGGTYEEKEESSNYLARIKRQDGSILNIEANNEYNVSLGARDSEGINTIPSLKDMRDLVKLTQAKKCGMNFGNDNDPEFNARLMIACMEAQPKPLRMRNAPQINDEFLANLSPETKQHLQNILAQNNNQQTMTPRNVGNSR